LLDSTSRRLRMHDPARWTPWRAMRRMARGPEARVVGCLIEKEITTPDQYPLTINALTSACNQKSNRDPVLDLDDAAVQRIVDGLAKRHLVSDRATYGGRVPRYKQIFCNTSLGGLQFSDIERAILCELLLRGPQSAGELRTRGQRMARIGDVSEVEAALASLAQHPEGPFVICLPRAPGWRDARWAHLLGTEPPAVPQTPPQSAGTAPVRADLATRVAELEAEVAGLRLAIDSLERRLTGG